MELFLVSIILISPGLLVACVLFLVFYYLKPSEKWYGLWGVIILLVACVILSLYTEAFEALDDFSVLDSWNDQSARTTAERVTVFIYIVPGLMLAVASNLISVFIQSSGKKSREKI